MTSPTVPAVAVSTVWQQLCTFIWQKMHPVLFLLFCSGICNSLTCFVHLTGCNCFANVCLCQAVLWVFGFLTDASRDLLHITCSVAYYKAFMLQVRCTMYRLLSKSCQPSNSDYWPQHLRSLNLFSAPCNSREPFQTVLASVRPS